MRARPLSTVWRVQELSASWLDERLDCGTGPALHLQGVGPCAWAVRAGFHKSWVDNVAHARHCDGCLCDVCGQDDLQHPKGKIAKCAGPSDKGRFQATLSVQAPPHTFLDPAGASSKTLACCSGGSAAKMGTMTSFSGPSNPDICPALHVQAYSRSALSWTLFRIKLREHLGLRHVGRITSQGLGAGVYLSPPAQSGMPECRPLAPGHVSAAQP